MKNRPVKQTDATDVLKKDGVQELFFDKDNNYHTDLKSLIEKNKNGDKSWARRVIYNDVFSATLIYQKPGETNRTHYHKKEDEWWVILKGNIKWWIEDIGIINASIGDIVFVPKTKQHKIKTIGKENSIRLAICSPDIPHFYPEVDQSPKDF